MSGRHQMQNKEEMPGPGSYCPEKVTQYLISFNLILCQPIAERQHGAHVQPCGLNNEHATRPAWLTSKRKWLITCLTLLSVLILIRSLSIYLYSKLSSIIKHKPRQITQRSADSLITLVSSLKLGQKRHPKLVLKVRTVEQTTHKSHHPRAI